MKKKILFFMFIAWIVFPQLGIQGFSATPFSGGQEEKSFLAISDEMKQFLDEYVIKVKDPQERLKILITSIFDRDLLSFEYSNNRTYTAQETFKNRTGNCLSYTAMFVVMARYVGLPAYFQEVYDYSHWTKRENIVISNRHMNVLVDVDVKKIEVDFHMSAEKKIQRAKVVNDLRAQAHYYNNIGVEALIEKKHALAESLFKKAIGQDESFSPAWTNLGILYQYRGKNRVAESSFKQAILLDKHNYTAQLNLSNLYKKQGKTEKAEKIRKRIKTYCLKNPFYHYNLGLTAFNQGKFELAIEHFKRAVKRDSKEPEFFAKLAAAYFKIGNYKSAEKYLKKAKKLARSPQQRILFNKKLKYIYSHRS